MNLNFSLLIAKTLGAKNVVYNNTKPQCLTTHIVLPCLLSLKLLAGSGGPPWSGEQRLQ